MGTCRWLASGRSNSLHPSQRLDSPDRRVDIPDRLAPVHEQATASPWDHSRSLWNSSLEARRGFWDGVRPYRSVHIPCIWITISQWAYKIMRLTSDEETTMIESPAGLESISESCHRVFVLEEAPLLDVPAAISPSAADQSSCSGGPDVWVQVPSSTTFQALH